MDFGKLGNISLEKGRRILELRLIDEAINQGEINIDDTKSTELFINLVFDHVSTKVAVKLANTVCNNLAIPTNINLVGPGRSHTVCADLANLVNCGLSYRYGKMCGRCEHRFSNKMQHTCEDNYFITRGDHDTRV